MRMLVALMGCCAASLLVESSRVSAQSPASAVGRRFPSEMRELVDEQTGLPMVALTTSQFSDAKPYQTHTTWTSDGQWILFRSERAGDEQQAFVVNERTGDIIQLTDGPGNGTGSLNLSRKAMKLYFMRGGRRRGEAVAATRTQPQLIELNIGALIDDSMAGAVKQPAAYERLVASLPDDLRDSGGFGIDADETKAYWGVAPREAGDEREGRGRDRSRRGAGRGLPDRDELLRRNSNAEETAEEARARFAAAGQGRGGIRAIDLATGEISTVIDVDFRMGHVQANPWEPGEIIYCHETGGDAPQRVWSVRADGTNNRPLYVETPDEWITHETVATRDELMFNILGHLPRLRSRPTGIAVLNLRTNHVKLLGQLEEPLGEGRLGGLWHCNGSPDGRWAVGDTFGGAIWVIDRANGKQTMLTAGHRMRPDHAHPIFSPDSRRVLIQSGKLSDGEALNLMVIALPESLLSEPPARTP
ncbi:MAG TPA: hypothetical protein VEQ85_00880 [Lacipirellulaceae bacterium]|nr:hypothetical protein [Lacipirellulaceae bacterium]